MVFTCLTKIDNYPKISKRISQDFLYICNHLDKNNNKHMKRLSIILLTAAVIACSCSRSEKKTFTIEKGVNIAHWLSQSKARGEARASYFTAEDVARIAGWGFDHVRIPIDEEQMFHEDGTKDPEAFSLLHSALDLCAANGLRAIVDLHILRSHHFNASVKPLFTERAAQESFYQCWREISGELKDYPVSMVAYELMNEPVADDPEDWNKIVKECYDVIRGLEKERVIVIGSNMWQSYNTVDKLTLPEGDPNIILSFHYYNPMPLTHYRASWTGYRDLMDPVSYPGEVLPGGESYDKERFLKNFSKVTEVGRKYGIPVYCGEYGCLAFKDNDAQRYRWLEDMNSAFDSLSIARAVWCYREGKGGFGILSSSGTTDSKMVEILTR